MAQNLQKMFCPSCGSPIQFIDGREYTFCQYCGHQIFREDTQLDIKLKHEQKKMKFADRHEERAMFYEDKKEDRKFAEKKVKTEHKNKFLEALQFIGLILLILFCLMMLN